MVREQNFLIKVLRKTKQNVKYNVKISTQSHVLEYNILSKNKKKFHQHMQSAYGFSFILKTCIHKVTS